MSDNYQEKLEKLYEKTTTPYWTDHCGHGGYLFSFKYMATAGEPDEDLDVYCWDNNGRQEFCLRFGDAGGDYRSPGGIENIVSSAKHIGFPYQACYELLDCIGDIRFVVFDKEEIEDA